MNKFFILNIKLNLVMEFIGISSLYTYLKQKPHRRLIENDARIIFT